MLDKFIEREQLFHVISQLILLSQQYDEYENYKTTLQKPPERVIINIMHSGDYRNINYFTLLDALQLQHILYWPQYIHTH